MSDFNFLQNPLSKKWIISAPRRSKRPDASHEKGIVCPFCIGGGADEKELDRIGGEMDNWQVRVVANKFPFAPIHEIILHSPDHHKNFDELPSFHVELIFQTYKKRYNFHKNTGQVYIFHNRGEEAGESLPHPHTQLVVVPNNVKLDIIRLNENDLKNKENPIETDNFYIFAPMTSQWPDEVWVAPKTREKIFGEVKDREISDLAGILQKLINTFNAQFGHGFDFNFYIYPFKDWYLRLIPRVKSIGGFEVGTGIFVNTKDPKETIELIRKNF